MNLPKTHDLLAQAFSVFQRPTSPKDPPRRLEIQACLPFTDHSPKADIAQLLDLEHSNTRLDGRGLGRHHWLLFVILLKLGQDAG